MPEIRIDLMSETDYRNWQHRLATDLAASQIAANQWPSDEAYERAREHYVRLIPDGYDSSEALLMTAVRPDSTSVGRFWIGPGHVHDVARLHGLEIDAEHRGQGLGWILLEAAERFSAERGIRALVLGIPQDSPAALALFASSGYVAKGRQLYKALAAPAAVAQFALAFVKRFPSFRAEYERHLDNEGGLAAHLLFGMGEGITDQIVEAYLNDTRDWRDILRFLDEHLGRWDQHVDEVLGTSFSWRLPWPGQPGYGLVGELPSRLRAQFDRVRPTG